MWVKVTQSIESPKEQKGWGKGRVVLSWPGISLFLPSDTRAPTYWSFGLELLYQQTFWFSGPQMWSEVYVIVYPWFSGIWIQTNETIYTTSFPCSLTCKWQGKNFLVSVFIAFFHNKLILSIDTFLSVIFCFFGGPWISDKSSLQFCLNTHQAIRWDSPRPPHVCLRSLKDHCSPPSVVPWVIQFFLSF